MTINGTQQVDLSRFHRLPREESNLILGWFSRSSQKLDCSVEECFDAFMFAWVAFNGWAACVTQNSESDKKL